jgi:hypothetical protein
MSLQVLLLKRDPDQTPRDNDLHPPAADLLGRVLVEGCYDAVVFAVVPEGLDFTRRNRLPLDGEMHLVVVALAVPEPPEEGIMRW